MSERPSFPRDELLYRRIVEDSPAAVVLLTNEPATRVLFASPRIEEISGFTPDELLAQPGLWVERLHPDEAAALAAKWTASVEGGERFRAEYRFRHRDGEWRWLRETSSPVREADGTIRYRQSFTEDITSERLAEEQAERSEARYRALVERLPVIVYVDSDDVEPSSLYVSPNCEEILGYAPSEFLADPHLWFRSMHPDDLDRVAEAWADAVRTRTPFHAEYRNVRPEGSIVWVRDHSILIDDEEGRPLFWQGVLLDITAEREAATAFDRSEARYRDLVEQLPVIVYIDAYGAAESSRYVSPRVADVLGYPPEAFVNDSWLWDRILHPDDHERVNAAWAEGWSHGAGWSVAYRCVHPDGHDVWVRDDARSVIDPATGEQIWQGVIVDLTVAKAAESELRRSEQRYRALVEHVPAVVYEMGPDDDRRTLFVSPRVEEILGYPPQEWLEQPDIWIELLHPDDRETELAAHDRHNETGEPWRREYRLIANDGRHVWIRDQAELVSDDTGRRWLGVMVDITAQKDAEELLWLTNDELELRVRERTGELAEANEMMTLEIGERRRVETKLRRAEARVRALVEHLPGVAYTWRVRPTDVHVDAELDASLSYTSPRIEDLLGYSAAEWRADDRFWETRIHPHDRERVLAATARSRKTGEPFDEELRYLDKDGHVVWVLERATLLSRDDAGRPQYFQGVMLDISDRKRAEEKADTAEERFRSLTEEGPVAAYFYELLEVDPPSLRMEYVSPQIAEIVGYPVEHWIGRPEAWFEMVHPDDRERVAELARTTWENGDPWRLEYRIIAGDGRI
ncbi:MAG: PAS domain-containing protein, partial [Actinomycetota bacterium]